jgi:Mn-dependent DtxR family transcriptional regulator
MLERLLEILAEGGAVSYSDLARTLGVDQALVRQMVEHLATLGYLRPVGAPCREECKGCSLAASCLSGPEHTWTLTEKGRRAAHVTGHIVV